MSFAFQARQELDNLGCFRNVGIYIDTSKGPKSTPDGLDVTFYVKEHKRFVGGITTAVGNNSEGNLIMGLRSPNVFGRGERIQAEYSYGSRKTDNMSVTLTKPLFWLYNSTVSASIFQTGSEWPWSGYRLLDKGATLDFQIGSSVKHTIQWEGIIRNLSVMTRTTSFDIREQCGPKLKSSIKHILSIDRRDHRIFPNGGSLFEFSTEFAGVGGNIGFLKNDATFQLNYSIFQDIVLQGAIQGGVMRGVGDHKKITPADQFYLGGPQTLRGFQTRGVGPHSDGDALGSDLYWASALHLYTPLPFRPGSGGFGDLFRTHFFVNCGSIGNVKPDEDLLNNLRALSSDLRLAYGFGIVLKLGEIGRVELNYCIPSKWKKGDIRAPGVQFGVGVNFL